MARRAFGGEIVVLSGLAAVRQNPWMYIGSVSGAGVHQLVRELVYNAVDEALLGRGKKIAVSFRGGVCRVEDGGGGIPTELHAGEGVSSVEVVFTRLHSGSKFSRKASPFSAGLHGVGLSCVNALSERLRVEIRRGGLKHIQEFRRGRPLYALKAAGRAKGTGTTVEFKPDPLIFKDFSHFDKEACLSLLEELSFLNPGLELSLDGQTFKNSSGTRGLLARVVADSRALSKPLELKLEKPGLSFSAALLWTTGREPLIRSYVNGVETSQGGTHVAAFRAGILRAVNAMMARTGRGAGEAVELDEATEGLAAAVSLKLARPNFESQTKSRLTNAGVAGPLEKAVCDQLIEGLKRDPVSAAAVLERILQARSAKLAARRAAEKIYFQRVHRDVDEAVYKEQFGARSKNWHDSAVWITDEALLKAHADLCRQGPKALALDVCCGSGVVGASFKDKVKKVVGLDLTPEMVAMAKTRLDEVRQGNVYRIPFDAGKFDLVCTREVLHLLPQPERPAAEIFRVLKPGGQFIVGQILPFGEEDAAWMYRIFKKKQPLIFNMFQEEDFRRLLTDAGFVDLEMRELKVWESIDVWIDSWETTSLHRHQIRQLYLNAPAEARAVHPFKISPSGKIHDLWRWCVFSARKPA